MALAAENSLSHSELVRWWQVSALLWTEGCTVTAKETRAGIGGYLPRRMCWWRPEQASAVICPGECAGGEAEGKEGRKNTWVLQKPLNNQSHKCLLL